MARVEQAFFDRTQAVNKYGNYTAADVPYFVFESASEDDAVAAVYNSSPSVFMWMLRESVAVEERINEDTFKVIARYQKADNQEEEIPPAIYTFDTGGGTQHITQSIETVNCYPADAPNYKGAIGYDGENVAGVDVAQPTLNLTETHYFPEGVVTTGFIANLARKTGMFNNDVFRGFEPGEVLFLGASGSKRDDDENPLWEITYHFAVSQNRYNFRVGDITVGAKWGWEYLWVRYADEVDDAKKQIVKKPVAAYVEKVYYGTSFAGLGLGGAVS